MSASSFSYRSFSMEYGTFVGVCWGAVFLAYVYGVVLGSGLLLLASLALGGFSLVLPCVLACRLGAKVRCAGARLGYWQGLLFSLSMFMYACLLYGLVVYVYFQLLDGGALTERLGALLGAGELRDAYAGAGLGAQYARMEDVLAEVGGMPAFEKALALFNNNFLLSVVSSFVVAVFATRGRGA